MKKTVNQVAFLTLLARTKNQNTKNAKNATYYLVK